MMHSLTPNAHQNRTVVLNPQLWCFLSSLNFGELIENEIQPKHNGKQSSEMQFGKTFPSIWGQKKVHLYLCAVFAPTKPHTSSSILENVSPLLLPSPNALLPVTALQYVRLLWLLSYFSTNQVSRAFSPPSLPPSSKCELILTSFFFSCVADPLGWAEWLDGELGRSPVLQREGNAWEGTSAREWSSAAMGLPTASHPGLGWHVTGKETSASEKERNNKSIIQHQHWICLSNYVYHQELNSSQYFWNCINKSI